MAVTIRQVVAEDRGAWETLFAGYAAFYRVDQTPEMRARVWDWLRDPGHTSEARLAVDPDGVIVGFTHFRPFTSQLMARTNCFLDDLFVSPDARGSGAAQALIGAVRDIATARGWGTVRWITADDNYRGRGVYDRVATRTMWITYDIAP